jgi:glutamate-1-semialdehyde 2,1-aminomutase
MTAASAAARSANRSLESALAEAEERYVRANPTSAKINAAAHAVLPGGNTRTTVYFAPFPLCIRSGQGARVTDADGHVYADFINEHTAAVFGHSDPVIAAALAKAIADGLTLGGPSIYEHELAAAITARFRSIERLRFCNSGTEANLLALATARAVTGRPAVMMFKDGYHGSLLTFTPGPSPLNVPIPFVESRFNDLEQARRDIDGNAGRLAAVIVEPMQGGAGALAGDPAFLAGLRESCSRHGILLVFDEVMTSRLGPGGLQGKLGIAADLTTLGKYIGGGMTIGAFGGRADIMARFDPGRPGAFPHGGTFNNNVLAMAAGLAGFTHVLTLEAIERMNARGDALRRRLNDLAARHGVALQATGVGSIFGLHFHRGPIRNGDDLAAGGRGRETAIAQLKSLFQLDLLERGLYVTRRILGNVSLATSDADTDLLVAALDEFLATRGDLIREVVA